MIQHFKFIIPLFLSVNSFAEIKVGDTALYKSTYLPSSPELVSFKRFEVIKIDQQAGTFDYQESEISGGRILYQFIHSDQLKRVSQIESDFEKCESSKIGVFENISVPAGDFVTCHVSFRPIPSMDADEYYFAKVPFGLIKKHTIVSSASGITNDLELVDFIKK